MKKNWTMRAGAVLVALTLVTSCFVGGTFAKYTTAGTGTDSARVAKFGVTVTANGTTFAKEYNTDNKDVAATITKSVISSDDRNVVAPGTKGEMVAMTLSGTPEVAVEVAYDAEVEFRDWTLSDDTFYCPLIITVGTEKLDGKDYEDADSFEKAVKEKIDAFTANYEPNTDLSKTEIKVPSVSWEWPFEVEGNDTKDTYLGDQAAETNAATVLITVTTTVTQID